VIPRGSSGTYHSEDCRGTITEHLHATGFIPTAPMLEYETGMCLMMAQAMYQWLTEGAIHDLHV
jgi:hypothetical protein